MLQQPSFTSQKLLFNRCQGRCQFSSQDDLGYVTKQAEQHSSFISSATCDSSEFRVLQEARLMLMCHRWGLLKTRFIHLSTSTEVLSTDFQSHKSLAMRWTVVSWSRVASASVYICQVQTLHFTTHVNHIYQSTGKISSCCLDSSTLGLN